MDLQAIAKRLEQCSCGREHRCDTKQVEIGSGLTAKTGAILKEAGFPEKILLVADRNTLEAARGVLESLKGSGFHVKELIYENLLSAKVEQVREVEALTSDVNDICRVAAYELKKEFCIFATAPSMDGFASDTAPIIKDNFKTSWQAKQPSIILADTAVLAKAPTILKSSGFGDMMAKYIGLVDWRVANLLINEYYCEAIAGITRDAVRKIAALADRITSDSEEAAGAVCRSSWGLLSAK